MKRRYWDWIEHDVLTRLFKALSQDRDFEWLSVYAAVIRAHQYASGAQKEKGGLMSEILSDPKGVLGTRRHAATDNLGDPVRRIADPRRRGLAK